MNIHPEILKQLKFRTPETGFGPFEPNKEITYDQVVEATFGVDKLFGYFIDSETPRLGIVAPLSVTRKDKIFNLDLEISSLYDNDAYYTYEARSIPFSTVLENGGYTLQYPVEKAKYRILNIGGYKSDKDIHFIDIKTGEMGHFPANVYIYVDSEDQGRFLIFENEEDRDSYYINEFDIKEDLVDQCECESCSVPIAPEKVSTSTQIPLFSPEHIAVINRIIEYTAHLPSEVRVQAILTELTKA